MKSIRSPIQEILGIENKGGDEIDADDIMSVFRLKKKVTAVLEEAPLSASSFFFGKSSTPTVPNNSDVDSMSSFRH